MRKVCSVAPVQQLSTRGGCRTCPVSVLGSRDLTCVCWVAGMMIGIELDEPVGKNTGTVKGVAYFNCEPKHGLLIRQVWPAPVVGASTSCSC